MTTKRTFAALLTALVACAAGAGTASAGEISYDGDTLVVKSGGAANFMTISSYDGTTLSVSDEEEAYTAPGDRCSRLSEDYPFECEMPAAVKVELGEGDDELTVFPGVPLSVPVHVQGEGGRDELRANGETGDLLFDGGDGDDVLFSEEGADVLLGGAGNDQLTGNNGADELRGGDGDDLLRADGGDNAPDVIDGGPGFDTVDDWGTSGPAISVTLDGQANDGHAGENDEVTDVEALDVFVGGTFVMGDGPDHVENFAAPDAPDSTIEGRGGGDTLIGGRSQHHIDGGAGDDRIEGGWGDDTIIGGPGRDTILGDSSQSCGGAGYACTVPWGNDTIDARDGEVDSIDCGVGEDVAIVDAADLVASCERVDTSGAPVGGGPVAPGGTTAGGGLPAVAPRLSLAARTKLRRALKSGLRVKLAGLPAGIVTLKATLGRRTVGKARARVTADGTATTTLRFTKTARRTLARRKTVRLTLTAGTARQVVTLAREAPLGDQRP
jgi:hypothetical protein